MLYNLSRSILATVNYYDILDYPLTAFEVWKHLISYPDFLGEKEKKTYSLSEVILTLQDRKLRKFLEEYRGFYFLRGRKSLVNQRITRNKISEKKLKILLRMVKWLRFSPFLKMIAVTGRLAMKNAEAQSDLDVLVVLQKGKIFTGRLGITLLTQFLGRRRHGKKIANRICFNHFITDQSLEIKLKDLFSASEYFFAFPVFGFQNFQAFQKANGWISRYKPNYFLSEIPGVRLVNDSQASFFIRKGLEMILSPEKIEEYLKQWQLSRIEKNPKTHEKKSLIVANEESLIFLPEPQGPEVFEKFSLKLDSLLGKTSL
jgi:predicted nucleotidyltransferase